MSGPARRSLVRRVVPMLLARPWLWSTALRQAARVAPPGWWRRAPFVPIPDREYVDFRLETQYGAAPPDPRDLVTYLEWCRDEERFLHQRHGTRR